MASTMSTDPVRRLALDVLLRFEKAGKARLKADSLLQGLLAERSEALSKSKHGSGFSETDRAFAHALVMGTLRHWLRIDEWLKLLTGRPLKQITPPIRGVLRLGLFQLAELSHVPDYAAIDSSVNLARGLKQSPKTVKFVNAVLREAQRRLEAGGFPAPSPEEDFSGHLLMAYGWPKAWTEALERQFSTEQILEMAQATQAPAPMTIRVNTLKTTIEAYLAMLSPAGFMGEAVDASLPEALRITKADGGPFSGSPRQLPGYAEGLFYVQDPSSMWVSRLMNPQPGEHVLDLCAAPGSKTTHIAALMGNAGRITAIEPKPERVSLLRENIARLGVENVEVAQADGLQFKLADVGSVPSPTHPPYSKVLVDAPCSGTGTLRRHPEILLQLRQPDFREHAKLQLALLEKGFELLKPGGTLLYSTCSLIQAENHAIVAKFLHTHPDARLQSEEQRPITAISDGFYAAKILKI